MATALLSSGLSCSTSSAQSGVSSSRVFLRDESSASFGGRHNGLRKFVTQRMKKCQQQQQRQQRGAGGVQATSIRPRRIAIDESEVLPVSPDDPDFYSGGQPTVSLEQLLAIRDGKAPGSMWVKPSFQRKTKIVCTIGPTSNTRELIWKLAEAGMNIARLNMSHGDHASHRKVIDLVREYNEEAGAHIIGLMLDTKGPEVRSGDLPRPVKLEKGEEFTFTIKRGVGTDTSVSVNYDDFVNDVEKDDILLIDGGMMSLQVKSKTGEEVLCEVVDGGELKSRRHLNVRGKSATLPSITDKDWEDIKFGVENKVDYYALSFVKDAQVVHELKDYLEANNADIYVIVKIESADSIPNLQSILEASDGAMVARGDLGAELAVEEVPLLQGQIIRSCRSMGKPVIVATNMLESMINHPTPTRAEVSDIAIAVREGTDAIMLSGETAHGKYPLKAVKVMHTVALRTEATLPEEQPPTNLGRAFKNHMSEMFAFHATMMSNTLGTSIVVFTRSGFMASLLSHYRPAGTIYAFTNERVAPLLWHCAWPGFRGEGKEKRLDLLKQFQRDLEHHCIVIGSDARWNFLSRHQTNPQGFSYPSTKHIQSRLAIYQGVRALYMEFSDSGEETFTNALSILQKGGMIKDGEEVALVQSGRQPIWRAASTHHIQIVSPGNYYASRGYNN